MRILPILFIVFVDMLGLTIILPLLHIYAAAFGAGPLEIGVVAAAYPLMQLVGAPIIGRLSDRYGRKPLLMISQVGTLIGFLMLAFANSLGMVLLSRMIDGLSGGNLSVAQAALTDLSSEKTRTQALGLTGAAFGLAFILGPAGSAVILAFGDNNYVYPALTAAIYSLLSIGLTYFGFRETRLEATNRNRDSTSFSPADIWQTVRRPLIASLLVLIFAQQLIFYGFENLLGLFTLSRLGMTGDGNALIFVFVGIILVTVQVRYIGPWSRKYGERRLIYTGLGALALGLVLMSFTPRQPPPLYSQRRLAAELAQAGKNQQTLGETLNPRDLAVDLPPDGNTGLMGFVWLMVAMVPLSVGGALLRPSINSLLTKGVKAENVGIILGVSVSLVSLANAGAPVVAGLLFEVYGSTVPFLVGGILMGLLFLAALRWLRPDT